MPLAVGNAQTDGISGVINDQTLMEAETLLASRPRALKITSPGGDVFSALKLAQQIVDDRVSVEANGLCASACASYAWAVSPNRSIANAGIVMFHTGGPAFREVVSQSRAPDVSRLFDRLAEQELALYERAGLDSALLYWPMYLQGGLCYYPLKDSNGVAYDVLYKSTYALVVFSSDVLRQLGLPFAGDHPNTEEEAWRRFDKHRGSLETGRTQIRFVDALPNMTLEEVKHELRQTRVCTSEDSFGIFKFSSTAQ